jgi:uncharacterized protein YecE (DUF72 family)
VGTSGWSYPEWVGHFYPNGTSPARMLAFYARLFPTVEAHSTYRRLPTISTVERWVGSVPPGFAFVPKAHLGITHRQDLDGVEDRMAAFAEAVSPLGEHLGPVLFSLPHAQPDLARLDRLLAALPPPSRLAAAFELSPAWATSDVVRRLETAESTLVLVENDAHPAPDLEVGPFTYVRLRRSRYTRGDLDGWAERLEKLTTGGRDAWVFFKHDEAGEGPRYARRVMGRLHRP